MHFDDFDAALITDEKQRLYYLGFHSTDGYVILEKDNKKTFVVDNRYFHAAERILTKKGIKTVVGSDYTYLEELIAEKNIKKLGIDFTKVTVAAFETLKKLGAELIDISKAIEYEMSVKTPLELSNIAKACKIAEKAFFDVLPLLKVGITEREVGNELEYNFKKYGASGTSFDTIIAFGKNAAIPHHETDDTRLKDNECVLMDFGCLYNGFCSDMTRTVFFGEPDNKFKDAYLAVLNAHMNAFYNIKAGMKGKQADAIARNILANYGLSKYFTHSLGHGIGVNIHEYPYLSPKGEMILENGMVFSIEPGVYLNDKFGIRIEDSCYLENGGVKTFMKDKKALITVKNGKIKKEKLYVTTVCCEG